MQTYPVQWMPKPFPRSSPHPVVDMQIIWCIADALSLVYMNINCTRCDTTSDTYTINIRHSHTHIQRIAGEICEATPPTPIPPLLLYVLFVCALRQKVKVKLDKLRWTNWGVYLMPPRLAALLCYVWHAACPWHHICHGKVRSMHWGLLIIN